MIINTWRDPYETGVALTTPKTIEINPGLTVLVGCNGAGKSTLLKNIQIEAKKNHIPCHKYDNLSDGGCGDIFGSVLSGFIKDSPVDSLGLAAAMWQSSEGECIKQNIGRQSALYKTFFETGYYKNSNYNFAKAFSVNNADKLVHTNKRILLFDAVDSGLSVDSVVDIKKFFEIILNDAVNLGIELYLIISANEYELARGSNCFDVNKGKYLTFANYEEYRTFILKSRELKERRIDRQIAWQAKQDAKEQAKKQKRIDKYQPLIDKIKQTAESEGRELSWYEKHKIDSYNRIIEEGYD